MKRLYRTFQKHIILQVFLATIPFLVAGLGLTVHTFSSNFTLIDHLGAEVRELFQNDTRQLEQKLLTLSDLNHRLTAQIIAFESDKEAVSAREEFIRQGAELRGAAVYQAATLAPAAVATFSAAGESPARILAASKHLFGVDTLGAYFWDGQSRLSELLGDHQPPAAFQSFVEQALKDRAADWFEDELAGKDVIVGLVPASAGVYIFLFDVSAAYSFFDRAQRSGLSITAAKQQEKQFVDNRIQQQQFQNQRQLQGMLIQEKLKQRHQVLSATQTKLLLLTALNLVALILTAVLLFWVLGTRKVGALNLWLKETSQAIHRYKETAADSAELSSGHLFTTALKNPCKDFSRNELGELSRNINYLLATLEETTVSKNLLSKEIEERKKMAAVLRESQQRLNIIFNSVQSGVLIIDYASDKIVDLNPAALAMLQARKEEIVHQQHKQFFLPEASLPKTSTSRIGEANRNQFQLQPLHGEPFSVLKTDCKILLDGRDILISNFISIEDIKKSKQQLEQAKQAAEQANRIKSDFLANMSHEIRTPLNGVLGMTQLFSETRLNEDQQRISQTIQAEADSLLRIINEILDFSKIEAGKMDLERIPFNLHALVEQVTENLAMRIPQKCLEAFSFIPAEVPTWVVGDPGRLQQVLTNLVNNAFKFTREGHIIVSVRLENDSEQHLLIRFEVEDTGIGIATDKLESIFDSFTQADGSTTRKYGGTGLGTTIAKQLVELMGGEIGVHSQEHEGTTFWFSLPFARVEKGLSASAAASDFTGTRVLVVDDNPTGRIVLERYLSSLGCCVSLASNGANALLRVAEEPFDLVLTDFNMPSMNGLELGQRLRNSAIAEIRDLPLVILSSYHSLNGLLQAQGLEIQALLRKPVKKADLAEVLRIALGTSAPADSATQPPLPALPPPPAIELRRQKQILLAEDYPTNQQIALRFLARAGYQVDIAENGLEAVQACANKIYDLVLMDIQMPEMDGYTATREIRRLSHGGTDRLPIVAMTAHATTGYKEKCLAADMNDYISKPIRKESFLQQVDFWALGCEHGGSGQLGTALSSAEGDLAQFDYQAALQAFLGDRAFLAEVIAGFQDQLSGQLRKLERLLQEQNFAAIASEAHTIKGGAYNLNATRLAQAAAMLEQAARENNAAECRSTQAELTAQFRQFLKYSELFIEIDCALP
ncbi:hybrid sensor histidine kinase/response regulator [Pelobacter seleniigenes]|uniref:hybrid sensor histidine kinase/response regulator n=1 Tax=Pelobacter seleniigenes TaxID=407188 RepID=UPI00068E5B26|nr:response regulator [Pelobacter seleniigenes]